MTDPYDRDRLDHDHVVTTRDSGYGVGTIIGAIVVALLVIAAIWWLLGGGLTINNTTNDNDTDVNPVPSVTVPEAPAVPGGEVVPSP